MEELERIEQTTDKVSEFQKKYNITQKKVANLVGRNLVLLLCMLIPLLLVGLIWVDFGEIIFSPKMMSDGVLTVTLFICGEIMMTRLGADGGKMDTDYIAAKGEFDGVLARVQDIGTMLLGVFCAWQIDVEMEQAIHYRLRLLRMTPKQFEEVKDLPKEELEKKYGSEKARKILEIVNLKPIELNEAILLYNGEYTERGGIPESGDAHLRRKSHIITTVISCIFTGLFSIFVAFTLTSDITFARVIYTVYKMTLLLYRMVSGYGRGARAFNTIEVRQLKAKTNYLHQYEKFVGEKMYLKLGDKYGDISCYINNDIPLTNE